MTKASAAKSDEEALAVAKDHPLGPKPYLWKVVWYTCDRASPGKKAELTYDVVAFDGEEAIKKSKKAPYSADREFLALVKLEKGTRIDVPEEGGRDGRREAVRADGLLHIRSAA